MADIEHKVNFDLDRQTHSLLVIATGLTEGQVKDFVANSLVALQKQRTKLEEPVSRKKGRNLRPLREVSDIEKQRIGQIAKVNRAIHVLSGSEPGTVKILTARNEDGKLEPIGFNLINKNNHNKA